MVSKTCQSLGNNTFDFFALEAGKSLFLNAVRAHLLDQSRPAAEVSGFAATPSDNGHGHGTAGDHHLDLDLGELPTLWYGETHQIRTDETLTPVQGKLSFSFSKV
jgi:hypothetical protein